jgi:cation diffusion facilitator family transporter
MKRSPKIGAARLSIATAASLAVLKLATGMVTGSMAVFSSAADSLLDVLASGVNFLAIRQAERPADKNHPFGHGKFETVATLFQAIFITASGIWIIFESIHRLIKGVELARLNEGITILAISVAASWWISRFLQRVARETDSPALKADSLHFSMDVYTNLALVAGLVIIKLFDITWLDPVLSIIVAFYILFEALRLVRHGLRDVLDAELPDPIRQKVAQIIEAHIETHKNYVLGYHSLRTRRAGSQKIMDFHLVVCKYLSVEEAHDIANHLEKKIQRGIPESDVIIHIEPCRRDDCPGRERCPKNGMGSEE